MRLITTDKIGNKRIWRFVWGTRFYFWLCDVARIAKRIGCTRVSRWIWKHMSGACTNCGAHVDFNSVVSRHGFTCCPCFAELEKVEKKCGELAEGHALTLREPQDGGLGPHGDELKPQDGGLEPHGDELKPQDGSDGEVVSNA